MSADLPPDHPPVTAANAETRSKGPCRVAENTELAENTEGLSSDFRQVRQTRHILLLGKYPEYLSRLSKTEKLKASYADNSEGLTDKEAAVIVYGEATDETAKKIADLRANLKEAIVRLSNGRPAKYGLAPSALADVTRDFDKYLLELREKERQQEELERKARIPQSMRDYIRQEREGGSLLQRVQTRHDAVFTLDWADLCLYAPELAEAWEADLQDQVRVLRMVLKEETGSDWDVAVAGFDDRQKIARIRSADYGRMLNVHAEVAAKGELCDRSVLKVFECNGCGMSYPVRQSIEMREEQRPRKCRACGMKDLREARDREEVLTLQTVTLQEIPELLTPGEQPRRLSALITGTLAERTSERLAIGSKVTVTGCYIRQREVRKTDYERLFLIFGVEEINDGILNVPATPEVLAEVARIRAVPDPVAELASLIYSNVVGHDTAKQLLALQPFGHLHILLLGLPGLGKTELARRSTEAYPRADFFQSTNATKAGITAAASKDEHTGRYVLEQNGLARLHPHGIAAIDELDKASDDVKFSLLGAMQDGKLKIRKTNVQADLPCVVNILATANPTEDMFDLYSRWWRQVDLPKPLYDRFTFVLLFVQDVRRIESFREFFVRRSAKRAGVSLQLRLVLREMVRDAWLQEPAVLGDEHTLRTMDVIMRSVVVPHPGVFGSSLRLTEVLPGLLEALCRITGDARPREWHFQKAVDLLMAVKTNHDEAKAIIERGETDAL